MVIKQPRTKMVFDFIVQYKRKHDGLSPTHREIQKALNLSSTNTVAHHVNKLAEMGLIEKAPGRRGGLMVTGGQWQYWGDLDA